MTSGVAVNRSAHTTMEEQEVGVKEDRRNANAIQKQEGVQHFTIDANERARVCANRNKKGAVCEFITLNLHEISSTDWVGCFGPEWFFCNNCYSVGSLSHFSSHVPNTTHHKT